MVWVQEMASEVRRKELIVALDKTWDTFKKICKFELKSIHPVAAVINTLPEDWTAQVKIGYMDHIFLLHQKEKMGWKTNIN